MSDRLWFYLPVSALFVGALAFAYFVFFSSEQAGEKKAAETSRQREAPIQQRALEGVEKEPTQTQAYEALAEKVREHGKEIGVSQQLSRLSRLVRVSPLEAESRLSRLLEENPNSPELTAFRADLYFSKGDFAEAAEWYRKVIRLDPQNRFVEARLAETLFRQGQLAEGNKVIEDALEKDPANIYALDARLRRSIGVELGSASLEEEAEKKADLLERARAKEPDNPAILKLSAREALALGKISEAIQYGERALTGNLHRTSRGELLNILYEAALMSQDQPRMEKYAKLIQQLETNLEPSTAAR